MQQDHDDLERSVASAGAPGLAALSALLRRLDGSTINVAAGSSSSTATAGSSSPGAKRVRSRMFLYTGSQR